MLGKIEGGRRRGRQRMRCLDGITADGHEFEQALGVIMFSSVQFSCSVMSDSLQPHEPRMPGLPVHHQLPESTQTSVH